MKNFNLKSLLIALVATFAIIASVFCSTDACALGSPYSHGHYAVSHSCVGCHRGYARHSFRGYHRGHRGYSHRGYFHRGHRGFAHRGYRHYGYRR